MIEAAHSKLVSFIWSIADDCLRDVYVRGKYRDVILPMVVLRRIDCLLENSKDKVLEEVRYQRDDLDFKEWVADDLREASGYVFYNTSEWTLQRLKDTATNNQDILLANFMAYLDGFSDNVKEIINKFKLRQTVKHLADKDVLLIVLERFTSPYINLTHVERLDPEGRKLAPLSNLGMGYVFEELIRRFNEENNEEAGEHFTPREVIDLMTHLVFLPIKDKLPPIITVYDPACGSGGMLTESQNFIIDPKGEIQADSLVYLYGKEINDETYAICKSDMMIKGNDPENIKCGSTLAIDEFRAVKFDCMLSNPPYGKSWANEQKYIKSGKEVIDHRFRVRLKDYWEAEEETEAVPRSSDGQLLFLMEMVDKMKPLRDSPLGSRIASVHNGSSLFTGDAGGGESNIRRHIIENDYLEAIIQLPNNLFYNTGISTYIWLLSNNKAKNRKGKVQLIDASLLYRKLRKNLGNKNCELTPEHIAQIVQVYQDLSAVERTGDEGIASQVFRNEDFGYYKVTIDRPKRLCVQFTPDRVAGLRFHKSFQEPMRWAWETYGEQVYSDLKSLEAKLLAWCEDNGIELLAKQKADLLNTATWERQRSLMRVAEQLAEILGTSTYMNYAHVQSLVEDALYKLDIKLKGPERKAILDSVSEYHPEAQPVVKCIHKLSPAKLKELKAYLGCDANVHLPHFGYHPTDQPGEWAEYESESDLRDTESVPLGHSIHAHYLKEVQPHVPEAWIHLDATKIGYEISFNKYFYRHKPLRSLTEVTQDILSLEQESEGLIRQILTLV